MHKWYKIGIRHKWPRPCNQVFENPIPKHQPECHCQQDCRTTFSGTGAQEEYKRECQPQFPLVA